MLKRTLIGALVLAAVLGAWSLDSSRPDGPAWTLAALGVIVSLCALDELLAMGRAAARRRWVGRVAGAIWVGVLVVAGLSTHELLVRAGDLLTAASALAGVYLVWQLREGPSDGVGRLTESLWFAVPYAGGLACLAALLVKGRMDFVIGVVLVAKASDVGAYFAGKSFGRHKLAARVSPNKTVEGAVGGLLLSMAVATWLLDGALFERPPGAGRAALFGLVLGAVAIVSDLAESLLKRSRGVKDSGRVFGESGGFLDLADSLLLVAPLALAYTALTS